MNSVIKKYTLRSIPLFSELNVEHLRKLTAISQIKKYPPGKIIFLEGDHYKGFYIQLKGSVKIFKTTSDGHEAVIHLIKPLNIFADIPLFEGSNYPVSAQTLEESILLLVPKEQFINLLGENPDIALKMLAGFAKRLKSLVTQVEDLSTKDVINRLSKYILKEIDINDLQNSHEPVITLGVPKTTLASYLGTITETLSRTFKKLQDQDIICVNGKNITVKNITKLKKLADISGT